MKIQFTASSIVPVKTPSLPQNKKCTVKRKPEAPVKDSRIWGRFFYARSAYAPFRIFRNNEYIT